MDRLILRANNEETFKVKIIDQYTRTRTEYEDKVDFVTLDLMLKAEYVTLEGTTIKKRSTRVDERGTVFFYGTVTDVSAL